MTTHTSYHSSPHKVNLQGYQQFAGTDPIADERRKKLVLEMTGHYVGPVPITEFLDFLPAYVRPPPHLDCSNVPAAGDEKAMYGPLHEAIEQSGCCPSFTFCDTSGIVDKITKLKPDGMLLPLKFNDFEKLKFKSNYMHAAEVIFELKPSSSQDAFDDKDQDTNKEPSGKLLEALTKDGMRTRGQVIDYITSCMSLQHRTFIFTVCITGHQARIVRWDRAGAIVSASFDYVKEQSLAEFLWRYNHATSAQRGFDENVSPANVHEVLKFTREVNDYLAKFKNTDHRRKMKCTLDHHYPTYKVRVVDSKRKLESDYLVRRPFFDALSPTGRATRGYIAWGIQEQELRFLKDTWRTDVPNVMSESQVYELLEALEVPHLPVVCKSGDVEWDRKLQCTLTDTYADHEFAWKRSTVWIRRHVHHRVVQELALPLYMVKSSLQLAKAIRNVLLVIELAFKKGDFLHRDISAGNVMLTTMFEGILNDWDHVIKLPLTEICHVYRTGTWQYISIALLKERRKLHAISDDVESAFWLLLNFAWRYFGCKHSSLQADLFDEMSTKEHTGGRIHAYGGLKKQEFMTSEEYKEIECDSKPLKRIIIAFGDLLYNAYSLRSFRNQPVHRVNYQTALAVIEDVTPVIKIFADAISSKDWPEHDDALPDSQRKQTTLEVDQNMVQGYHAAFSHDLSMNGSSAFSLPTLENSTQAYAEPYSGSAANPTALSPSLPIRSTQAHWVARRVPDLGANSVSSQVIAGSKRAIPNDGDEVEFSTYSPSSSPIHAVRARKKAKRDDSEVKVMREGEGRLEGSKDRGKGKAAAVEVEAEQTTQSKSRIPKQVVKGQSFRRQTRSTTGARGGMELGRTI